MTNRVHALLLAAQAELNGKLGLAAVHTHGPTKGDGAEEPWRDFLERHLPRRYEVTHGFVVDADGDQSNQMDLIICDRQYTTVLLDSSAARYVPAESVYATFEVKQNVSKEQVEYAQKKLASVRRLKRTSTTITHAGGTFAPRKPFQILGGLLATRSDWVELGGEPLRAVAADAPEDGRLNLVVGVDTASVEILYGDDVRIESSSSGAALPWFFLTLVHRLQALGTVSAADYLAYRKGF